MALESGRVLDSGKCFWILWMCFEFWEMFLESGTCFGFWEVFLESGTCLDSGKCFVLTNHRRFTCIVYMYDSVGKSII